MQALSLSVPPEHDIVETALSPDGHALVYSAVASGGMQLFLRRFDRRDPIPLAGTQDAVQPFFSPDGQQVGFFARGYLRWIALDGTPPVDVISVTGETAGASWGPDDRIVFAPLDGRGLQVVSLAEDTMTAATTMSLTVLDTNGGETSHGWPHLVPDGRSIIFTVGRVDRDPRLAWMSLATEDRSLLAPADGGGFYLDTGHLVYARRGEVFALPVDAAAREVTGPSRAITDRVTGTAAGYARVGRSSLVASRNGRLVYAEQPDGPTRNRLVWVDRQGVAVDVDSTAAQHQAPRISPDGSRIAVMIRSGTFTRDLWIQDVTTGSRRQLTLNAGDNHSPVWSPDGRRMAFASNRDGPQQIYRTTLDVQPEQETLVFGDGRTPGSWSPDGRSLFFHESYPERGRDIWVWTSDTAATGSGSLIIGTEANERAPAISPDGRWLAFVSDAADGDQVYLREHPGETQARVSRSGGTEPVWSRSGSELFFREGRRLFVVDMSTPSDRPPEPQRLFAGPYVSDPGGNVPFYDVHPDAERFLMLQPVTRTTVLQVLSNWQAALLPQEP